MKTNALERLRVLRGERYRTPGDLPADWRCEFEEKAAELEYDALLHRELAEHRAFLAILARMRAGGESGRYPA